MTARISLSDIVSRLESELVGFNKIGSSFDFDYQEQYARGFPQVWVIAQRVSKSGDPLGYTGHMRQHCRVEIAIQVLVQRNKPGTTNNEAEITTACQDVEDALFGWKPAGADLPLQWELDKDGPVSESALVAEQVFSTQSTTVKTV